MKRSEEREEGEGEGGGIGKNDGNKLGWSGHGQGTKATHTMAAGEAQFDKSSEMDMDSWSDLGSMLGEKE